MGCEFKRSALPLGYRRSPLLGGTIGRCIKAEFMNQIGLLYSYKFNLSDDFY
jgi:hypothetical protein